MKMLKRTIFILSGVVALVMVATILYNNNTKTIFSDGLLAKVSQNGDLNSGPFSFTYKYYDNYEQADKISNIVVTGVISKVYPPEKIVIGEDTNTLTGEVIPATEWYIVSDIKVDKVIKGDYKQGDIIKVKQISGLSQSDRTSQYFKVGEKKIFF